MEQAQIVVSKNGLKLTGAAKPGRNDYIRVRVEVVDDLGRAPHDAWNDAVCLASRVYGVMATEDGTVGQAVQVDGASGEKRNLPTKGRVFSLGLNLHGLRQRDVLARIAEATGAAKEVLAIVGTFSEHVNKGLSALKGGNYTEANAEAEKAAEIFRTQLPKWEQENVPTKRLHRMAMKILIAVDQAAYRARSAQLTN